MHASHPFEVPPIADEFQGLNLGDRRRNRRALNVVTKWSANPRESLPKAMASVAELEGAYRLMNNEHVSGEALLGPHRKRTWERASQAPWVLSVEDTTELRFGGELERDGLGELMNGGQGFYLHMALLVLPTERGFGVPAGVGAYEILVRDAERERKTWKQRIKDPTRESMRWHRVSDAVAEQAAAAKVPVVHVCDREADDYAWLESVLKRGGRFVVRNAYNRRIDDSTLAQATRAYLWDRVSSKEPVLATREVSFQARTTSGGRRRKDPRAGRKTLLEVRAASVEIARPERTTAKARTLALNVVAVTEPNPPHGEEPIEWTLLTTEAIATEADVLRVVDAYRARWLIEEFFKALKTGCQYERLQFETLRGLRNALALCLVMAWRMLALRTYARDMPDEPVEKAIEPDYLRALQRLAKNPKNPWGLKLGKHPTVGDVLYAVARLGGHLKNNGPPGWLTLSRGFEVLEQMMVMLEAMEIEL